MADLEDITEALPKKEDRTPRLSGKAEIDELPGRPKGCGIIDRGEPRPRADQAEHFRRKQSNTVEAATALWERFLQRKYDAAGADRVETWLLFAGDDDEPEASED